VLPTTCSSLETMPSTPKRQPCHNLRLVQGSRQQRCSMRRDADQGAFMHGAACGLSPAAPTTNLLGSKPGLCAHGSTSGHDRDTVWPHRRMAGEHVSRQAPGLTSFVTSISRRRLGLEADAIPLQLGLGARSESRSKYLAKHSLPRTPATADGSRMAPEDFQECHDVVRRAMDV
jgi:hypothetical protein